jgi:nucleoside-triphosphatase
MFSREKRVNGVREGFEIVDVGNAKVGCLAHINQKVGPTVGKYRVNLADLESIGVEAINRAVEQNDVVVIDEIGPMELFSAKFHQATEKALNSNKLVVAVVHLKAQDQIVAGVKQRPDAEVITVSLENREGLADKLIEKAIEFLNKTP